MSRASDLGKRRFSGITRNVVIAGVVSLLTDVSSEMIYPVLPLFLVNVLGVGTVVLGLIEGIAEATASLVKIGSGWLSDRVGRRKPLMLIGYALSDLTKPLLAFTVAWPQVLTIRFADRFGKGVRGAPRDALIADSTPIESRGKAFGFHRAMDTLGAAIGPLATFGLLALFAGDYRLVFAAAAVPGVLAIVVLAFGLRERPIEPSAKPIGVTGLSSSRDFVAFAVVATLFGLGNSSDAFLILRAQDIGLAPVFVPLAYFGFNIVHAILAMPMGSLSDRVGRQGVIVAGYLVFAAVYVGFAVAGDAWHVWPLFASYGLYAALTDGVQRAYVTDLVPASRRASALGILNAATGVATLPASIVAGLLWQQIGPSASFYYGAAVACLAALLFLILLRRGSQSAQRAR